MQVCQLVANTYHSWHCVTLCYSFGEKNLIKILVIFWGWISNLVSTSSVTGRQWSNLQVLPGESWPWLYGIACLVQGSWVTGSWGGLLKHTWSLILYTIHRRKFSLWLHSCFWHPNIIPGDKRIIEWISSQNTGEENEFKLQGSWEHTLALITCVCCTHSNLPSSLQY